MTLGQPVPANIQVQALIDTGASGSCVDPSILAQLTLTPTGSTTVNTPTTGADAVTVDQYDVGITIPSTPGHAPLFHHTVPVIAANLLVPQGFHVIIGRDILQG